MFGLGFPEIIFIFLVAVLILGPEHTPRAARLIGKWSSKLRSAATTFNDAVTQDADLREIKDSLTTMKSEIDMARSELKTASKALSPISEETHQSIESARAELREIQAQTGRSSAPHHDSLEQPHESKDSASEETAEDNDKRSHSEPVQSSFMSRALGAEQKSDFVEIANTSGHVRRTTRLPKPVFLPEKLSILVSRSRVPLSMPSGGIEHRIIRLKSACHHSAFCKICRISVPAQEEVRFQKRVSLKKGGQETNHLERPEI